MTNRNQLNALARCFGILQVFLAFTFLTLAGQIYAAPESTAPFVPEDQEEQGEELMSFQDVLDALEAARAVINDLSDKLNIDLSGLDTTIGYMMDAYMEAMEQYGYQGSDLWFDGIVVMDEFVVIGYKDPDDSIPEITGPDGYNTFPVGGFWALFGPSPIVTVLPGNPSVIPGGPDGLDLVIMPGIIVTVSRETMAYYFANYDLQDSWTAFVVVTQGIPIVNALYSANYFNMIGNNDARNKEYARAVIELFLLTTSVEFNGAGVAASELSAARATAARELLELSEGGELGGHLIERHVGLTEAQLADRIATEGIKTASTFATEAEAAATLADALEANAAKISEWLNNGAKGTLEIDVDFSGGTVLEQGAEGVTEGTGASFFLRSDGQGGFYVVTGYPTP